MKSMKWSWIPGLTMAAMMLAPAPATAQDWDDRRWERLGDRIAAAMERSAEQMERAFDNLRFRADLTFDDDFDRRWEREWDGDGWDDARVEIDLSWLAELGDALDDVEWHFEGLDWDEVDWDDVDWDDVDWDSVDRERMDRDRRRDARRDRMRDEVERRWDEARSRFSFRNGEWDGWREDAGPRVNGDDFEWRGRVDRGDVFEIKGISGSIRAVRGSGDEVEVVATKSARRSDPNSVTIEVIEHRGGVTLCALYPTPDDARRDNECGVGDDGRMSVNRNDTKVEWEVRIPEGVRFDARNVNGDIEVERLASDVRAWTVNGDVEISTTGSAQGETVNGDVRAAFERLGGDVSFETVNGSVRLDVDDDIDADLDASWVNGSLESDIPLRLRGRMGRRSAEGSFGDGGPLMRIRTVNGSIEIR